VNNLCLQCHTIHITQYISSLSHNTYHTIHIIPVTQYILHNTYHPCHTIHITQYISSLSHNTYHTIHIIPVTQYISHNTYHPCHTIHITQYISSLSMCIMSSSITLYTLTSYIILLWYTAVLARPAYYYVMLANHVDAVNWSRKLMLLLQQHVNVNITFIFCWLKQLGRAAIGGRRVEYFIQTCLVISRNFGHSFCRVHHTKKYYENWVCKLSQLRTTHPRES
jgi:hypothetical protein